MKNKKQFKWEDTSKKTIGCLGLRIKQAEEIFR